MCALLDELLDLLHAAFGEHGGGVRRCGQRAEDLELRLHAAHVELGATIEQVLEEAAGARQGTHALERKKRKGKEKYAREGECESMSTHARDHPSSTTRHGGASTASHDVSPLPILPALELTHACPTISLTTFHTASRTSSNGCLASTRRTSSPFDLFGLYECRCE